MASENTYPNIGGKEIMNTVKGYSQYLSRRGRYLCMFSVAFGFALSGMSVSAEDDDFLPDQAKLEVEEAGKVNKAPKPDAHLSD